MRTRVRQAYSLTSMCPSIHATAPQGHRLAGTRGQTCLAGILHETFGPEALSGCKPDVQLLTERVKAVVDLVHRLGIGERIAAHTGVVGDVPDGALSVGGGQSPEMKPGEGVAETRLAL